MTDAVPGDITIGEVWRGMEEMRHTLGKVVEQLQSLPSTLATELDARTAERVEAIRSEFTTRLAAQGERVGRLEKIVYGFVALVMSSFVLAVAALVIHVKS